MLLRISKIFTLQLSLISQIKYQNDGNIFAYQLGRANIILQEMLFYQAISDK